MDKIALIKEMKKRGVYAAAFIATEKIPFDPELRKSCTPKRCQSFGKNWGCPPDVGEINMLIAKAKSYDSALVYETVYQLEDSFDYEGMLEGGVRHKQITNDISELVKNELGGAVLQLSAGGCTVCETCSKLENQPCRFPEKAIHSVSAYGIYVSKLTKLCGLNYNNGENTVTLFGIFFFHKRGSY